MVWVLFLLHIALRICIARWKAAGIRPSLQFIIVHKEKLRILSINPIQRLLKLARPDSVFPDYPPLYQSVVFPSIVSPFSRSRLVQANSYKCHEVIASPAVSDCYFEVFGTRDNISQYEGGRRQLPMRIRNPASGDGPPFKVHSNGEHPIAPSSVIASRSQIAERRRFF